MLEQSPCSLDSGPRQAMNKVFPNLDATTLASESPAPVDDDESGLTAFEQKAALLRRAKAIDWLLFRERGDFRNIDSLAVVPQVSRAIA